MRLTTMSAASALDLQASAAQARAAEAAYRDAQPAQRNAEAVKAQAEQLKQQIREQIRADFEAVQGDGPGAAQQGRAVWPPEPPPAPGIPQVGPRAPNPSDQIPAGAVDIVATLGITLVCCVVGLPLARAIARWIDRRGTTAPVPREVVGRLDAIDQAVESVAVEVERISEGQRFTTRMLSDRAPEPAPEFLPPSRDAVPVDAVALNPTAHAPANARRG